MEVLWTSAATWAWAEAGWRLCCGLAMGLLLGMAQKAVQQCLSFQFLRNILPTFSSVLLEVVAGGELKLPFVWVIMATPVSLHLIVN